MKHIHILTILLIGVFLISGCAETQSLKTASCPNLKGIETYAGYSDMIGKFNIADTGNQLFDGWQLKGTGVVLGDIFTPCEKGSKAGENIHYYYCRDMTAKKIDVDGNIIDTKKITVVVSLYFNQTLRKTTSKEYITTIC